MRAGHNTLADDHAHCAIPIAVPVLNRLGPPPAPRPRALRPSVSHLLRGPGCRWPRRYPDIPCNREWVRTSSRAMGTTQPLRLRALGLTRAAPVPAAATEGAMPRRNRWAQKEARRAIVADRLDFDENAPVGAEALPPMASHPTGSASQPTPTYAETRPTPAARRHYPLVRPAAPHSSPDTLMIRAISVSVPPPYRRPLRFLVTWAATA